MPEDQCDNGNGEEKSKKEFGPLKAADNNNYQIEGEDWGGLKPQAAKNNLKQKYRTWLDKKRTMRWDVARLIFQRIQKIL